MITYKILEKLDSEQKSAWLMLFTACFHTSRARAEMIYRKYDLNDAKFCLVFSNGRLVAAYSGLSLRTTNGLKIFLSTDTMSSGEIKGGSIIAATHLYTLLTDDGYDCICGYPNKKIIGLRQAKLDWKILKQVDLFMRIVPKKFVLRLKYKPTFTLNRPDEGFFGHKPTCFKLGKYKSNLFSVELRLSSENLGRGYLNISNIFPHTRKYFGYRILRNENASTIVNLLDELKLMEDSIDVP